MREVVKRSQETGNVFRFVEVNAMRLPQPNHAYVAVGGAPVKNEAPTRRRDY